MLANEITTPSAALLNDKAMSVFTFDAQAPFLNIALDELQEELQLNNVPITNRQDNVILIHAGVNRIGRQADNSPLGSLPGPDLPPNLIEPIMLYERIFGSEFSFHEMKKVEFLPINQVPTAYLLYWQWIEDTIHFPQLGANSRLEIRIDYIKSIFKPVAFPQDIIEYERAKNFLTYRTAALCAEFIGENKSRSDELNGFAGLALIRTLGISTKGRQSIITRRRPFMAGWRARRII